jgi:hypothetical protein
LQHFWKSSTINPGGPHEQIIFCAVGARIVDQYCAKLSAAKAAQETGGTGRGSISCPDLFEPYETFAIEKPDPQRELIDFKRRSRRPLPEAAAGLRLHPPA